MFSKVHVEVRTAALHIGRTLSLHIGHVVHLLFFGDFWSLILKIFFKNTAEVSHKLSQRQAWHYQPSAC